MIQRHKDIEAVYILYKPDAVIELGGFHSIQYHINLLPRKHITKSTTTTLGYADGWSARRYLLGVF